MTRIREMMDAAKRAALSDGPGHAVPHIIEAILELDLRIPQRRTRGAVDALMSFDYVNWRGNRHSYVVDVEDIECRFLSNSQGTQDGLHWVVNGQVVTRDGSARPEMGDNRRRTFVLARLENVRQVPRSR